MPFLKITTPISGSDFNLFQKVINQGIDSHLEAFTKSKFFPDNPELRFRRMNFHFYYDEISILLRRLKELKEENANIWADDIEQSFHKKEHFKTIWHDGHTCNLISENGYWRLEAKNLVFDKLDKLENYYKGNIKTITKINIGEMNDEN